MNAPQPPVVSVTLREEISNNVCNINQSLNRIDNLLDVLSEKLYGGGCEGQVGEAKVLMDASTLTGIRALSECQAEYAHKLANTLEQLLSSL